MPKVHAALAAVLVMAGSGCGGGHAQYVPTGDGDADGDGDVIEDAGDADAIEDADDAAPCAHGTYEGEYVITDEASLAGLAGYTRVDGRVWIWADHLSRVDGLECLASVGDDLSIAARELTSLDGLSALTTVGGNLEIDDSFALTSLDGLSALTSVGTSVWVFNNFALPTCEAEALCDRLRAHGFRGSCIVSGNCDTCACE